MNRQRAQFDLFYAEDVEGAIEVIYQRLLQGGNRKVIYFNGWEGFGASAVLTSLAEALQSRRTTPELCFDRLIFVDCSKWKNRREVQRVIAEELKLDRCVMAIDKQDEEDDFNRIDERSRMEIDSVGQVIDQTLSGTKFLMIFLNGSDEEVDVGQFGIPRFARYGKNMMIWTFNRSSLTMHQERGAITMRLSYTHSFLYSDRRLRELTSSQFRRLLIEQASTIVARVPCMLDIDPTMVADCCLYELVLHYDFHIITGFDWASHACNYWTCDAIIQGDTARDIGLALHREINWKCDEILLDMFIQKFKKRLEPLFLVIKDDDVYEEAPYRWISVTSKNRKLHGLQTIPAETSSFMLAFERSGHPPTLPNGLFEHSYKLGVIVLCGCAFDFASPPFLKCHRLRFLGLDRCTNEKTIEGENHAKWLCLYSLWVLDIRYTEWNEILSTEKMDLMTNIRELNVEGVKGWQYTANLQHRLPKLQRLRIIKPTCRWETLEDADNYFIDNTSIEILDLSGNCDMKILPASLSKANSLKLLVLDGCAGLESVGRLPASIESFSFDGRGPASHWKQTIEVSPEQFRPSTKTYTKDIKISKISLEGCTRLKSLFLCWLPNLVELDLSGTAIKVLDFNTTVVYAPMLKRLFLVGCKHLQAIIPFKEYSKNELIPFDEIARSEINPSLELVCIDTRAGIVCPRPSIDRNKSYRLQMHVVLLDARLTRSFGHMFFPGYPMGAHDDVYFNIHITSLPVYDGVVQFEANSMDKIGASDHESLRDHKPEAWYSDVLSMVGNPPMEAFPQPPTKNLDHHVEIGEGSFYVDSELEHNLSSLMENFGESIHFHDVSVRAFSPQSSIGWYNLKWCRVERCPKLDVVFPELSHGFTDLMTFWASDLRMARWIASKRSYFDKDSFKNLQHLHLRSCPSLQYVFPVSVISSFPSLETLHVVHCDVLVHIFELYEKHQKEIGLHDALFPKLNTVHLHDLPKLQQICEVKMMAPKLDTMKIRGCWSLRRLPSVEARPRGAKNVTIEIEKDVWDALEWDTDHRPDHFEAPVHSRYYKKKLPRVSFLR